MSRDLLNIVIHGYVFVSTESIFKQYILFILYLLLTYNKYAWGYFPSEPSNSIVKKFYWTSWHEIVIISISFLPSLQLSNRQMRSKCAKVWWFY